MQIKKGRTDCNTQEDGPGQLKQSGNFQGEGEPTKRVRKAKKEMDNFPKKSSSATKIVCRGGKPFPVK